MNRESIVKLIQQYFEKFGKSPTISSFCDLHKTHPATIINNYGSWNNLLIDAGLQPNKANKRTNDQLLLWLKAHPNNKYSEIPNGIRSALEDRFGSVGKAREKAGLLISDWRKSPTNKKRNAGRPIEYDADKIIKGLIVLAETLKRPPKMKDISKRSCGFPLSAIFSRFGSFNAALKAAELPINNSYHELKKLEDEFKYLMINIKIVTGDIPLSCNDGYFFRYADRVEEVVLCRSNIEERNLTANVVYYLVDDSLYENDNMQIICAMDISVLSARVIELRNKFDEINRKYIKGTFKNNITGL